MGKKLHKKFALIMMSVIAIVLLGLVMTLIYWRIIIIGSFDRETKEYKEFRYHYALITDSENDNFWGQVYEGASDYGQENDAYIEVMGKELAVNYSQSELMEIAIKSGVDGIIIEGNDDEKQIELINKAADEGIPVITMVNDNYGGRRASFVGIGNYNLGREYARTIIRTSNKEIEKVAILGNSDNDATTQNLLMNGFSDTIQNEGNHLNVETELRIVNSSDVFRMQQTINSVLVEKKIPNVIVCLDESTTRSVYQAVVESNLVGQVSIIGYYKSEEILSAIDKEVITASIYLNGSKMGSTAVEALNDYNNTGFVSDYLTIEAVVIDKENVGEFIENDENKKED